MTIDEIISNIAQVFSNQSFNSNHEIEFLNKANEILYSLKEQNEIIHYYFSSKIIDNKCIITIFLQKDDSSPTESWDLSVDLAEQ